MRVLIKNEMVFMWLLDTLYSLLENWLRDHISWTLSRIWVKIKSLFKNFWYSILNFTTPRYEFLFSNLETCIVHVINCKWSRSVNFSAAYVLYVIQTCIFQQSCDTNMYFPTKLWYKQVFSNIKSKGKEMQTKNNTKTCVIE